MLKRSNQQKKYIKYYMILAKTALVWVVLLSFTLSICGCGKQDESIDVFGSDSSVTTANELPMPSVAASEEDKILVISMPPDVETMPHPLAIKGEELSNLYSLIFEQGLKIDSTGKIEGCVIESFEVDGTGCIYTFHIRKNVSFHGERGTVSADDIINCLDRIMAADVSKCVYAKYKNMVASYKKIDDYTVELTSSEKSRDILYLMTFPIIPKSYYGSKSITSKNLLLVGTGPYVLSSYSEEAGMVLLRNEYWWKTLPLYNEIDAKPIDTSSLTIGSAFLSDYNVVTTSLFTANSYSVAGKENVYPVVTPYFDCLVPNTTDRFLKDTAVRRAISYAIDRSTIISSSMMGLGEAAATALNPNFWATPDSSYNAITYDLKTANQILDEAGYLLDESIGLRYTLNSDGSKKYMKIELLYTESTEYEYRRAVAEQIKKDLLKIGIDITLVKETADIYLSSLESRKFDISLCDFSMYTNNDVSFLFEDPYNYGKFPSSNLKKLFTACASAVTEEEIQQAFTALEMEFLNNMPIIGLYFQEHVLIADANIPISTKLIFKNVYDGINEWK